MKKKPVKCQAKPTNQSATCDKKEWVKFEKLLREFQPEGSKLLSGGLEATHQKLQRNSKHIVKSLESTEKACEEIEKSLRVERTFYDKLYDMHLKRVPKMWQEEARKVYATALTWNWTNDGNRASSNDAPELLMAPFKSLEAGQRKLNEYHKVFLEFYKQHRKFRRLTSDPALQACFRYHDTSVKHQMDLEAKQCRFLHSQCCRMARSSHLSLDLLQEAFYNGLYETFEISNEEREQAIAASTSGSTYL